jgi:hypothetical protein
MASLLEPVFNHVVLPPKLPGCRNLDGLYDYQATAKTPEDAGAGTDLTFGIDLFNLAPSPLQEASLGRDSQGVAKLLKDDHLGNEADKYGRTSRFYAGQAGHWEMVGILLRAATDPLADDNRGRHPSMSPLMYGAETSWGRK